MALVSPQQVSDGTSIVASNVNNPVNTIANDYNGNITDANISASAAISGSKIATASIPTTTLINDWQTNYVLSGGVVAISSGLVGTCSNVTLVIDGYKMTLSSIANKTYTASKDTYVDILRTGTTPSIVYTEVANAAASPALASSSLRLAKVITSGAAITSVTQNPNADSLGNTYRNTGLVSAAVEFVPYKFSVWRTAATNTGSGAFAVIAFDTKEYDTGANVASGVFTAPVPMFARFEARASWTSTRGILSLFKNGAEVKRGTDSTVSSSEIGCVVVAELQLAASDTVDVRAFGAAAAAISVGQATCYFMGSLISTN